MLVLGSTQAATLVDGERLAEAGVELVRRRSGGGAVLLAPGNQVWADLWVPFGDPLWSAEPRRSAELVGEWWAAALAGTPVGAAAPISVHRGGPVDPGAGALVCFAGVGPGEVVVGGRKLVGLAQWRSREGALVHGCAYRRWEPAALSQLLVADGGPGRLLAMIAGRAVGLDELGAGSWGCSELLEALPDRGSWEVLRA
jgi:lipoate---protein ligase